MNSYEWIICHYGKRKQIDKAIEEFEELTVELIRMQAKNGKKKDLVNELADVMNMIYQIMIIYQIKKKDIQKIMAEKIQRTLQRIEEERHENEKTPYVDKK